MLFNSFEFIFVFLPIVLILYYGFGTISSKLSNLLIVIASLIFYSYWDYKYLPLLVISILFNYSIGKYIAENKHKAVLVLGVTADLLLLGYFKYTGFFLTNINALLSVNLYVPSIILPLGISFYTFTQIAYLVDAYRGETKGYTFSTYSIFVTFFPHLIAGPILYHKDVIPQFLKNVHVKFNAENFAKGIVFFTIGLTKKMLIADEIASWVNLVFTSTAKLTFLEAWAGALGYTLQLYFDFSGYSDMAIGLGLMLNIILPLNFMSPYKSFSIIDFWRRWHITLSVFLKNYLYIPLGGNRKGKVRKLYNLFITMLLGGLWHGAGWNFVIWGGLHGLYLIVNHLWRDINIKLPNKLAWLMTFLCVVAAWVFFRAANIQDAMNILAAMSGFNGFSLKYAVLGRAHERILYLIVLVLILLKIPETNQIVDKFKPSWRWCVAVMILLAACLFNLNRVSEFLYFQF